MLLSKADNLNFDLSNSLRRDRPPGRSVWKSDLDGRISCSLPIFLYFRGIEPQKYRWDAEGGVPYAQAVKQKFDGFHKNVSSE